MPRFRRTSVVVATSAVILAAGLGVAYAYWSVSGSGSGDGTAGTNVGLTAVQTSTVTAMAPGVSAQTLSGNFTNTNSGPAYVSTVTAAIGSVTKAGGAPAGVCDATDYTLASAAMTVNAQVPTGTVQGSWTGATLAFNNKAGTNQDGCKGATLTLAYSGSGQGS